MGGGGGLYLLCSCSFRKVLTTSVSEKRGVESRDKVFDWSMWGNGEGGGPEEGSGGRAVTSPNSHPLHTITSNATPLMMYSVPETVR